MIDIEVLRALVKAGASAELLLSVVEMAMKPIEERRQRDAERKRKERESKHPRTSADVTGLSQDSPVTPSLSSLPSSPPHPPNNSSSSPTPACSDQDGPRMRPARAKATALPADWPTQADLDYALGKGWTADKLQSETQRFADHARANGRRQLDWHAAWRNWVTSPYQTGAKANGRHKSASERAFELAEEWRTAERNRADLFGTDDDAGGDRGGGADDPRVSERKAPR